MYVLGTQLGRWGDFNLEIFLWRSKTDRPSKTVSWALAVGSEWKKSQAHASLGRTLSSRYSLTNFGDGIL
jgi:hypothetical protein